MYIEQLVDVIKMRPEMYITEQKIECLYNFIMGYSYGMHKMSSDEIDKKFNFWFWKWLQIWIHNNINTGYESKTVFWYEDIKAISSKEDGEMDTFFKLVSIFFGEYKEKGEELFKDILEMMNNMSTQN